MKPLFILISLLIVSSLSACTADQAYGIAHGWQRNQCYKIPDKAELDRCLSNTNTSYESYKKATEPGQK